MTAIHIVTPFSRPEYFPFLKANLAQADSWTLLVTPGQAADFSHQIPHPLTVVDGFPEGSDICYAKVNAWIVGHASNIRDEDYYQFMCDDDALPTGVLPTLKSRDEDIIVEVPGEDESAFAQITRKLGSETMKGEHALGSHKLDIVNQVGVVGVI